MMNSSIDDSFSLRQVAGLVLSRCHRDRIEWLQLLWKMTQLQRGRSGSMSFKNQEFACIGVNQDADQTDGDGPPPWLNDIRLLCYLTPLSCSSSKSSGLEKLYKCRIYVQGRDSQPCFEILSIWNAITALASRLNSSQKKNPSQRVQFAILTWWEEKTGCG